MAKRDKLHYKNGDRVDNRLENLELWSSKHPAGQRIKDLVEWAYDLLDEYEDLYWSELRE